MRDLIRRVHNYSQTLRDPAGWFAAQLARFQSAQPDAMARLAAWSKWKPGGAPGCPTCNASLPATPTPPNAPRPWPLCPPNRPAREFAAALAGIVEADKDWPRPKGPWRDPIKEIFDEAEFLVSVCAEEQADPLAEDWEWVAPVHAGVAGGGGGDSARPLRQAKRHEGGIDYHDLEQFALRLLREGDRPERHRGKVADRNCGWSSWTSFRTSTARRTAIIEALSREGAEANRFLVGDVKQSIYRFRLADPGIFVRCQAEWAGRGAAARVLGLAENFRSHEGILNFVNAVFGSLMREEVGGVAYPAGGPPAIWRARAARRPGRPA